jgi:hypothetical protein
LNNNASKPASDDKFAFQGINNISKMIVKPKIDYRLAKDEVYINEIGLKNGFTISFVPKSPSSGKIDFGERF